ncbi:MAG: hypothetical protein KDA61_03905 [Planctomycetales bacterium]|nr:hypothetical protein [Planctomycetales bacterium]
MSRDEILQRLQELRDALPAEASEVRRSIEEKLNWKAQIIRHPWTAAALTAALGYFIAPKTAALFSSVVNLSGGEANNAKPNSGKADSAEPNIGEPIEFEASTQTASTASVIGAALATAALRAAIPMAVAAVTKWGAELVSDHQADMPAVSGRMS